MTSFASILALALAAQTIAPTDSTGLHMAASAPSSAHPEGNSKPQITAKPFTIPMPQDIPYPGVMTLEVDARDNHRAIFHVRQHIPVPEAGEFTLLYPQWLPGKHAPAAALAEFAGLKITTPNGERLAWQRPPTQPHAFTIDVPKGVDTIIVEFDFLSPTRPSEGRVNMTPAMMNIQWEQVSLYPAGYFTRNIPVQLNLLLPEGWTGVAALDGLKQDGNRYSYATTSYETLIDSPMFAGEHYAKWDLGQDVTLHVVADEAQFLKAEPEHIEAHRKLVDESIELFGGPPFDRYEFLLALTKEMGGIGLEHHRSSENTRATTYFTEWKKQEVNRGLLPHELVHAWNGKYRRPDKLWTPDYRVPMQDTFLWVYEGQTSFWDMVLGARAGMQSHEMVFGEWARTVAYYSEQAGREWRSVEDTTHDPVAARRKPRPFPSWSRTEDYYREGSLIWLEADMIIRNATRGRRSLDDFARRFFGGRKGDYGEVTYDFNEIVQTLNRVHRYDWADFLTKRFRTPGQPAPVLGIEKAGYRLVYKEEPNVFDRDLMKVRKILDLSHSLGLVLDSKGSVRSVMWNKPAFQANITNGTKVLAVNGRTYSRERLEAAITAAKDGVTPVRLLLERNGHFREEAIAYHDGLRWPHLEKTSEDKDLLTKLLTPRTAN